MQKTFEIVISGQVQGVGFRPFVYGLAKKLRMNGTVCNNGNGVLIHVNGSKEQAGNFLGHLLASAPKVSIVQSHTIAEISFLEHKDFSIVPSVSKDQINNPLTPDFAICEACKQDIRNPGNRRFGYAFTTCTHCGPRYAITKKFPFERMNTTVSHFVMCADCQAEYDNPGDRRFHSQTNTCATCGIQLQLTDAVGNLLDESQNLVIEKTAELLLKGNIVAVKNTNGYVLCCDANNDAAIQRLRSTKQRPAKPFALLYPSYDQIQRDFEVSDAEQLALLSSLAPIVILNPKEGITGLARESIAPGLQHLGVMLPSSALFTLLMDQVKRPIIATSGNIHGSPIIAKEEKAVLELAGVADYFLHHDLTISFPQDDSVVRFSGNHRIIIRRSRGLAPNFLQGVGRSHRKMLAMGAHLKSSFASTPNAHTYVSPYFGNLDNFLVSERYKASIGNYNDIFAYLPEIILTDKHPQYQSSQLGHELAQKWRVPVQAIQHHKAHFASVLAEHDWLEREEKVLGVIWDGTGFGDDGTIWGGEFFTYKNREMQHLTHFEHVDWLAADNMAKQPRISLLSMLPKAERQRVKDKFSKTEWKVYTKMLESNTLKTSSVGRLFDAVACLLLHVDKTSYEGEAAMLLENEACKYKGTEYINFLSGLAYQTIPTRIMLQRIQNARKQGIPNDQIANSFIHTLALVVLKVAQENNIRTVACSGGVFQNAVLVGKLLKMAENTGVQLKFNRILSSNDENISLGQLWYHQHIKN